MLKWFWTQNITYEKDNFKYVTFTYYIEKYVTVVGVNEIIRKHKNNLPITSLFNWEKQLCVKSYTDRIIFVKNTYIKIFGIMPLNFL